MKRLHVIEELCNGCRLCQSFCSSLAAGVFSEAARIQVLKTPGEEHDIPLIDCNGRCLRSLDEAGTPACVAVCPTGAIIYADLAEAAERRLQWEQACQEHSLFKVVAPWKWPFPWNARPASNRGRA
jgi:Fe-S-cluster-containing dehydrogenase component